MERDRVNITAPDIIKSLFDATKCYYGGRSIIRRICTVFTLYKSKKKNRNVASTVLSHQPLDIYSERNCNMGTPTLLNLF
jgi:hypothetical protein